MTLVEAACQMLNDGEHPEFVYAVTKDLAADHPLTSVRMSPSPPASPWSGHRLRAAADGGRRRNARSCGQAVELH